MHDSGKESDGRRCKMWTTTKEVGGGDCAQDRQQHTQRQPLTGLLTASVYSLQHRTNLVLLYMSSAFQCG